MSIIFNKRFVTLFPNAKDIDLIKDVGMIPHYMQNEFGLNSCLACYNNKGNYYYNNDNFEIDFISSYTSSESLDGLLYILMHSKKN